MAEQLGGGGGGVPDLNLLPPEDGVQALPPAAAAEVDRISSLPEEARLHILSFLPLKTVIAMERVSRRWRALVSKPPKSWDSIIGIHIQPVPRSCPCPLRFHFPSQEEYAAPRGRLLCFILHVQNARLRPADFTLFVDYADRRDVEDLHLAVDARSGAPALSYNFQRASRSHHLVRLSLIGVRIDGIHHPGPQQQQGCFNSTLEVIGIENTSLDNLGLIGILLSCTRLRVLVLRRCRGITSVDVTAASARLQSLTVADCPDVADISAGTALGLRTFSYIGVYLRSVALPQTCFRALYICFRRIRVGSPIYNWLDGIPNLSNLTFLTVCSNTLRIVSLLRAAGNFEPQLAKLSDLQNLRELQLLMNGMKTVMLSDMYGFLGTCRCSRLRKLFVELPKVGKDSFVNAVSELADEPPMDVFGNLVMVKITNFKWQCNEIELVHFLFRKASSLQRLILVVAPGHAETDQSGNPLYRDEKLLCSEKAPVNAKIVILTPVNAKITETRCAEIWAFHDCGVSVGYYD